jgi:hypothetical protein
MSAGGHTPATNNPAAIRHLCPDLARSSGCPVFAAQVPIMCLQPVTLREGKRGPPPGICEVKIAKTAGPYPEIFRELEQLVAPDDEIAARLWGLTGWSMNWWLVASQVFGVLLVLPFILGRRGLYSADLALCGSAAALLSVSWWTRSVLVIAITRQRQLLCCRMNRPFRHKTISQAPMEAARFADFRRGWLFSQIRYRGPGTDGKTARLNLPAGCRQAGETLAGSASSMTTS